MPSIFLAFIDAADDRKRVGSIEPNSAGGERPIRSGGVTTKRFRDLLAAAAVCAVAGALALLSPAPAIAQADGPPTVQAAPAMRLEQVKPPAGMPKLTVVTPSGTVAHMFPTVALHRQIVKKFLYFGGSPPLIYHGGGSVMQPSLTIYNIYWTGGTAFPSGYVNLTTRFAQDYPQHGIQNNSTQYYQIISGRTTYIKNVGKYGGSYVDNSAYPSGQCTDQVTGTHCIIDATIQAEVKKAQTAKGWTGGLSNIFLVYTNQGEGSCFTSISRVCAYTQYCAYHSYTSTSPPSIYATLPYGNLTFCQEPGTPSPNNNPAADTVMTQASHEITEAQTDPLTDAWYDATGSEIGDECAYDYGYFYNWDSGKANQNWNGHYYELQTEFDNHAFADAYSPSGGKVANYGCSQTGPFQSFSSQGL
jgi:hypothetical protein